MLQQQTVYDFIISKTSKAIDECCEKTHIECTEYIFNMSIDNIQDSLTLPPVSLNEKLAAQQQLRIFSNEVVNEHYDYPKGSTRTVDVAKVTMVLSDCVIECFNAVSTFYVSEFYNISMNDIKKMIDMINTGFVSEINIHRAMKSYKHGRVNHKNKFCLMFTFLVNKLHQMQREEECCKYFLEHGANASDLLMFFGIGKARCNQLKEQFNIPRISNKKMPMTDADKSNIWRYLQKESGYIVGFYERTPIPAETIMKIVEINPHDYNLFQILESIKYWVEFGAVEDNCLNMCFLSCISK